MQHNGQDNTELQQQAAAQAQQIAQQNTEQAARAAMQAQQTASNVQQPQSGIMPMPPSRKKGRKKSSAYTAYYAAPKADAEMQAPPVQSKKKRGWKVVAIIAVMLACMTVGCIFGVGVIAPLVYGGGYDNDLSDIWEDWEEEVQAPVIKEDDYPADPSISQIGGETPVISNTVNPVPEIAAQLRESVVGINAYETVEEEQQLISRGTGFVIHADGYILTNFHVIASGSTYTVSFDGQEEEYAARFVGGDATMDLAVLKIERTGLKPAALGNSAETQVGELAVAMGNPAGADANLTGSVTVGYVSYVNRQLSYNNSTQSFLQIDTAVNPGNSGGPLLNAQGEVIGVVTLKSVISSYDEYGQAINSEGLGFAIPMDTAGQVALSIIQNGSVKRPGIGILFYFLDVDKAAEKQLPQGALIDEFMAGSTAREAGLEIGDVIVRCNGIQVTTQQILVDAIARSTPGDLLTLTVWRNGEVKEFNVVVGDMNRMVTY